MTVQEIDHIRSHALAVWDEIGGDILSLLEEEGQEALMPRDHVIEVVCDASRLKTRLENAKEYTPAMEALTYREWCALLSKHVFGYDTYGW